MLKIVTLLTVSILLSMGIISAIESDHDAEAMKSAKKQQKHKYSLWVGNQVCGDELCPGTTYYKLHQKYRIYKSPYDTYQHQDLLKIKK